MSVSAPPTQQLFLHVQDDILWQLIPGEEATGIPLPTVGAQICTQFPTKFHLLGTESNFGFITQLLAQKPPRLEVLLASPLDVSLKGSAKTILSTMLVCHRPAYQGGWHVTNGDDEAMYSVYHAWQIGAGTDFAFVHPAWQVFAFLGITAKLGVPLLAKIIDPRWFAHPTSPNRLSRLTGYLGLLPRIAQSPDAPTNRLRQSAQLVTNCWQACKRPIFSTLFDEYRLRLDEPMSTLRTSQRFIQLLHNVWLSRLILHPEAFVPEYFFHDPREAAAYAFHAQSWQRGDRSN